MPDLHSLSCVNLSCILPEDMGLYSTTVSLCVVGDSIVAETGACCKSLTVADVSIVQVAGPAIQQADSLLKGMQIWRPSRLRVHTPSSVTTAKEDMGVAENIA